MRKHHSVPLKSTGPPDCHRLWWDAQIHINPLLIPTCSQHRKHSNRAPKHVRGGCDELASRERRLRAHDLAKIDAKAPQRGNVLRFSRRRKKVAYFRKCCVFFSQSCTCQTFGRFTLARPLSWHLRVRSSQVRPHMIPSHHAHGMSMPMIPNGVYRIAQN